MFISFLLWSGSYSPTVSLDPGTAILTEELPKREDYKYSLCRSDSGTNTTYSIHIEIMGQGNNWSDHSRPWQAGLVHVTPSTCLSSFSFKMSRPGSTLKAEVIRLTQFPNVVIKDPLPPVCLFDWDSRSCGFCPNSGTKTRVGDKLDPEALTCS